MQSKSSDILKKIFFPFYIVISVNLIFSLYAFGAETSVISDKTFYGVSDWAEKEVREAVEYGLVPEELQKNYTNNITRREFCKLCVSVMKAWDSDFQYKKGNINFSDTDSIEVLICAERGIVNGIGDNKFAPDNPVKRQEAVKMLYNTLNTGTDVISEIHKKAPADGVSECCVPHSFDDGGDIRSWARKEICHMYRYGVMLGDYDNKFNPDGYYTREQAIVTFLRLFKCEDSMEENPIPEKDFYPYGDIAWAYDSDMHATVLSYYYVKDKLMTGYIDSAGQRYTTKEKGYVYPLDSKYAAVVDNVGAGVGSSVVIDQKDQL